MTTTRKGARRKSSLLQLETELSNVSQRAGRAGEFSDRAVIAATKGLS